MTLPRCSRKCCSIWRSVPHTVLPFIQCETVYILLFQRNAPKREVATMLKFPAVLNDSAYKRRATLSAYEVPQSSSSSTPSTVQSPESRDPQTFGNYVADRLRTIPNRKNAVD